MPKRTQVQHLREEAAAALLRRIDAIASSFQGQLDVLESAVGMLVLGRLFGWKVLTLIHNKRTIRKYQQILGIDIRKEFDSVGPLSHKSIGLEIADKLDDFWRAVSGDIKIAERRELR